MHWHTSFLYFAFPGVLHLLASYYYPSSPMLEFFKVILILELFLTLENYDDIILLNQRRGSKTVKRSLSESGMV
jgi:hypothetical protein